MIYCSLSSNSIHLRTGKAKVKSVFYQNKISAFINIKMDIKKYCCFITTVLNIIEKSD